MNQNKPSQHVGQRVTDGGVSGTLATCEKCGGNGLLFQPDIMPAFVSPSEEPKQHWVGRPSCYNPECPDAGKCGGRCPQDF